MDNNNNVDALPKKAEEKMISFNDISIEKEIEKEGELVGTKTINHDKEKNDTGDHRQEEESASTSECPSIIDDENHGADNDEAESEMPLLKYARILGSIPRKQLPRQNTDEDITSEKSTKDDAYASGKPFSQSCKCSVMGRVTVDPSKSNNDVAKKTSVSPLGLLSDSSSHHGTSTATATNSNHTNADTNAASSLQQEELLQSSSRTQTLYILAMGMEDGTIHLIDPRTGIHICPPKLLSITTTTSKMSEIVSLSFDASGTYLSALSAQGDVAIFELRFGITTELNNSSNENAAIRNVASLGKRPELKVFDSFLSRIAGEDWTASQHRLNVEEDEDADTNNNYNIDDDDEGPMDQEPQSVWLPRLKLKHAVSTARYSFKVTSSKPVRATCIVIDPSYKRKRGKKCSIVGFSNGRLVYTERGGHGGTLQDSGNFGGVMGNLLQPKRQDKELYQGTGGHNDLGIKYQGIEAIAWRGNIVSWADSSGIKLFDIDRMSRISHIDRPSGARASLYPGISSLKPTLLFERNDSLLVAWGDCLMNIEAISLSPTSNKRAVKCKFAWELDCVACSVTPIDSENVAVLGLDPNTEVETEPAIEIQVINRKSGAIVQSDILPLIHGLKEEIASSNFILQSSFATPRMEDIYEIEEEEYTNEAPVDFDLQSMLNMELGSAFVNTPSSKVIFKSPWEKWNIQSYTDIICSEYPDDSSLDSNSSEYSDDYTFLFDPTTPSTRSKSLLWNAPIMVITSPHDAVLVQPRGVDDSIDHARKLGCHGLALRRGLDHRQIMRRHSLNDLVDEYVSALLLLQNDSETPPTLTIRRLQIAAKATGILFGGNIQMWTKWIKTFSNIPGALFLLRPHIPTRDPKLPHTVYEFCLLQMFRDLVNMHISSDNVKNLENDSSRQLKDTAISIFLEALRAWGSLSSLKERMKLHQLTINEFDEDIMSQTKLYYEAETAFAHRMKQTAKDYLHHQNTIDPQQLGDLIHSADLPSGVTYDSLFQVETLIIEFRSKIEQSVEKIDTRIVFVILEILAELSFMKGSYKEALYNFLALASYTQNSLSATENEAILSLQFPSRTIPEKGYNGQYKHVLSMIENQDLYRLLLKKRAGGRNDTLKLKVLPPIVSLINLVGLESSGTFIIQHCTIPRSSKPSTGSAANENRSDLPINHVAAQLNGYPKLLFWFLERIIPEKPEVYVQFPNTAVPPSSVTDLHRIHFNLHLDFADRSFDESKKLTSIPSFDQVRQESPLLKFLKVALPHGGIRSDDARNKLVQCRLDEDDDQKIKYPHLFAHELAYVIERSSSGTEEDAREVLKLYLEGVVSLPLAVEFVERHTTFSSLLWEALIEYCLEFDTRHLQGNDEGHGDLDDDVQEASKSNVVEKKYVPEDTNTSRSNGELFGCLLEVAARSGADLAHLVSQIPQGMSIHGIQTKLVNAISDYRFKLKINEDAAKILENDKVSLLSEQCHRSRRGVRVDLSKDIISNSIHVQQHHQYDC